MSRQTNVETCKKKVPYLYKSQARAALLLLKRTKGYKDKDLEVYKCNVCQKFHIGHKLRDIDHLFDNLHKEKANG